MATSDPTQPPIACTLGVQEFAGRIAWIEDLTRRALRDHIRDDLMLRLTYAPDAAAEVRDMVERERACCNFMTFDLHETPDLVTVAIIVPESARDAADMLFGLFLRRTDTGNA